MTPDPLAHPVMDRVRKALGRPAGFGPTPPVPPEIPEHVARLVHSAIGLPELFVKRASEMKMLVETVSVDDLLARLTAFLKEQGFTSVMLSDTPVITRLNVCRHLREQGFEAKQWADMTADEAYDFDVGITEVDYAVAETGTVVIRHTPQHGRLLSLVPFVHVAIVEPSKLVPDLIDLMDALKRDGTGSGTTFVSGPSKTADIEMNTVTGVHGPNVVKAFVLG
ncbi:MAG TPA: LUD domain-containing protein [Humisphaera sp.]